MGLHHDTDAPVNLPAVYAPPAWRQLGIIVSDGSTSMTWDLNEPDASIPGLPATRKADAVDSAIRDFMNLMKTSRKASNFAFAFVAFNDKVASEIPPRDLLAIDPSMESYDPTAKGTGGTLIACGLEAAHTIALDFIAAERPAGIPVSVVTLVMSDGVTMEPERAVQAAQALKDIEGSVVACSFFADKKDPNQDGPRLLRGLASGTGYYQTVYTAEQLRKFFMASMTNAARSSNALVPLNGAGLLD